MRSTFQSIVKSLTKPQRGELSGTHPFQRLQLGPALSYLRPHTPVLVLSTLAFRALLHVGLPSPIATSPLTFFSSFASLSIFILNFTFCKTPRTLILFLLVYHCPSVPRTLLTGSTSSTPQACQEFGQGFPFHTLIWESYSLIWGQLGLHSKILSQKQDKFLLGVFRNRRVPPKVKRVYPEAKGVPLIQSRPGHLGPVSVPVPILSFSEKPSSDLQWTLT